MAAKPTAVQWLDVSSLAGFASTLLGVALFALIGIDGGRLGVIDAAGSAAGDAPNVRHG